MDAIVGGSVDVLGFLRDLESMERIFRIIRIRRHMHLEGKEGRVKVKARAKKMNGPTMMVRSSLLLKKKMLMRCRCTVQQESVTRVYSVRCASAYGWIEG